jgi:hypothetical protein
VSSAFASDGRSAHSHGSRQRFLRGLRTALREKRGFAAGKLGFSEQVWLQSCAEPDGGTPAERARRAAMRFHACTQAGVFPDSDEYVARCGAAFLQSLGHMDFVAAHTSPLVEHVVARLGLRPHLVGFNDLEPNRSIPYEPADCYLPDLQDLRVLIVTTPADLLVERAVPETFAAVWRSTGCPWFYPASLEALSFTSVFDPSVREKFGSSLELESSICGELCTRDFDVALVGASSMGVPIVRQVKEMGKVGLSLGGHLQVLFGVQGRRWRDDPAWQRSYWNDSWVDMPTDTYPRRAGWVVDDGAYW